jgi:hypothetical protein
MSNNFFDTIPKDLPISDPLLFSFVSILDSMKININFNGSAFRNFDKNLPAFEYAVNNWTVTEETENGDSFKYLEQTVLCALWKDKPEEMDCKIEWTKNPDGTMLVKEHQMNYLYLFEAWKLDAYNDLQQIINLLVAKNPTPQVKNKNQLADIFGWSIVSPISYVYAKDATANKYYGVGATFTLRSPYIDCCPKVTSTSLQLDWFKEKGFIFNEF